MAELIVVSGSLSTNDFNAIGTYLETKYDLNTAFPDASSTAIPEPSTLVLSGIGLLWLGLYAWRRRRRA